MPDGPVAPEPRPGERRGAPRGGRDGSLEGRRRSGAPRGRRDPGRRPRHRVLFGFLLVLGLLLVLAAVTALQARSAYRHLDAASAAIPVLRGQVTEGKLDSARTTAEAFQEHTASARGAVHGPHWSLLAVLPGTGPNVSAVQTVTESVDDLADDALPRLLDAAEVIDPATFAPRNGRVDLAPIEQSAPDVTAAHEAIGSVRQRLATLDTGELVGPLRGPVDDLVTTVDEVHAMTGTAAKAVELIPPMLGADEPRHYLLLSQNNAEPRALGGIPGAVILLRAHEGKVDLVGQRASGFFGDFGDPVLRLSPTERSLYGTQLGRFMQNVTSTPDFPRAAELAREMWRVRTGRTVDGVASVDPVALGLLLDASGPVRLPTGQRISGDNAAQLLLNQVYLDLPDPAAQDAYFAAAASAIFLEVMSGGGDLPATTTALAEATDQGRVMLWSARRAEQATLSGTTVSGELRGDRDGGPVVGVYVHDRTGAKIGYYEHVEVDAEPTQCNADGSRLLDVSVTVSSQVPRNAARLPEYVTGGGRYARVGDTKSTVFLYAPTGGIITDFRASDGNDAVTTQFHQNLHVAARTVSLAPGKSVTFAYRINSREPLPGDLQVRLTPGPAEEKFFTSTLQCP